MIESSFLFDDYDQTYIVTIPPQKSEITVDNIAVFIFTDHFAIWVEVKAKISIKDFISKIKIKNVSKYFKFKALKRIIFFFFKETSILFNGKY